MTIVDDSLDLEGVQHVLLVGERSDVEARQRQRCPVVLLLAGRLGQCVVKPVAVAIGVVGLEARVVPVGVERAAELLEQCRGADPREADVPLDAVEQCGPGQVRRPDVGGVVGGRAPEHPRLGVQPSAKGVVLDLDLGAEVPHQAVERIGVGGAHVRRGDDAEGYRPQPQPLELGFQQPKSVPLDERAQQVDLVAGVELSSQLRPQTWLAAGVGEQRGLGQWCRGTYAFHRNDARTWRGEARTGVGGRPGDPIVVLGQRGQEVVDDGQSTARVGRCRQEVANRALDVTGQDMWLVGVVYRSAQPRRCRALPRSADAQAQWSAVLRANRAARPAIRTACHSLAWRVRYRYSL